MTKKVNMDDQIIALLKLPVHTDLFNEYKEAYTHVTGRIYNGSCSKCGIKRIYKLLRTYVNGLNK